MERSRWRTDRTGVESGPSKPRDVKRKNSHVDHLSRTTRRESPRRAELPFHHAALFALSGARVRISVSDNCAEQIRRWPGRLRCRRMYWLSILYLGLSLGRADCGMGFACAQDSEVYSLR